MKEPITPLDFSTIHLVKCVICKECGAVAENAQEVAEDVAAFLSREKGSWPETKEAVARIKEFDWKIAGSADNHIVATCPHDNFTVIYL